MRSVRTVEMVDRMTEKLVDIEFFQDRFHDEERTMDIVLRTISIVSGGNLKLDSKSLINFFIEFNPTEESFQDIEKLAEYANSVKLPARVRTTTHIPVIAKVAEMAMNQKMSSDEFSIKLDTFFNYKNTISYAKYKRHALASTAKAENVYGRIMSLKSYVFGL